MCWQLEKEAQRVMNLTDKTKHTPTLAEQYSRFIPVQVTRPVSLLVIIAYRLRIFSTL